MNRLVVSLLLFALPVFAQDTNQGEMKNCPMHAQHAAQSHQKAVENHGDQAMGFPHDKTTHHFLVLPDGGAIEVTVNDATDNENLKEIRMHLRHIAAMFADGNFSVPMFVHSQTPPGVAEMTDRKDDITYTFEELAMGARVRILTQNRDAINAVHDFLNFQIRDHKTGDKTE